MAQLQVNAASGRGMPAEIFLDIIQAASIVETQQLWGLRIG
jgi:hypothetical protein